MRESKCPRPCSLRSACPRGADRTDRRARSSDGRQHSGHDIDECYRVTEWTLRTVFRELYDARVDLEGMVLKPNMVIAGQKFAKQASAAEVAEKTIKCLKATVPASVPGIAFLSGGQSDEVATEHLSLMNAAGPLPWSLTFSTAARCKPPRFRRGAANRKTSRPVSAPSTTVPR